MAPLGCHTFSDVSTRKGIRGQLITVCPCNSRGQSCSGHPYLLGTPLGTTSTWIPWISRRDWYYHAAQLQPVLEKYMVDLIRKVLPSGSIRVGYGEISVHRRQERRVLGLEASSWPSFHDRPAWPSTPTFNEWLEMIRFGDAPNDLVYDNATVAVPLRQFNTDIGLARRIIRRQVIGIRSDIAVPEKFWGYFRYRWNFLILTSPTSLPSGLTRFLASVWCTDPHSLWLERKVTLKQYLRDVPRAVLNRTERLKTATLSPRLDASPERLFTSVGPPINNQWLWDMEGSISDSLSE